MRKRRTRPSRKRRLLRHPLHRRRRDGFFEARNEIKIIPHLASNIWTPKYHLVCEIPYSTKVFRIFYATNSSIHSIPWRVLDSSFGD